MAMFRCPGVSILSIAILCLLQQPAAAAPISFNFSGVSAGPQSAGFNAAEVGDPIFGTFTFDDSLFTGAGAFRISGNSADFIEQEYPDAFIVFGALGGTAVRGTEEIVQTTARPDLRFFDADNDNFGVTFGYDNLKTASLGGFINLSFPGVATVDDPLDLVGVTGEALYRTQFQVGTNVFYLFDITVDSVVADMAVSEPGTIILLGTGMIGFVAIRWSVRRRRGA